MDIKKEMPVMGTGLAGAAQREAATRPVIGGLGVDATRQSKLDVEIGLDPAVAAAKKKLSEGTATPEDVDKAAKINQG